MTAANQVTIFRILLIPVFVGFALYYGNSHESGAPDERWRYAAIFTFLFAAGSDGLDGYLARRFNQRTRLGSILDPIADKGLLISALITLSVSKWPDQFPLWFPLLVIARDVLAVGGALLLGHFAGLKELRPHWTGKVATVLQMGALGALMLQFPTWLMANTMNAAAAFTLASGAVYLAHAIRMVRMVEGTEPTQPNSSPPK